MNAAPTAPDAPLLRLLDAGGTQLGPALCSAQPGGLRGWPAQELRAAALALAHSLHHTHAVRPADRVAWLGNNHPHQLLLLLALAQLGAMLVPLNFRLAPAEWDAVLHDCGASLLVHDAAWDGPAQALARRQGIAALPAWHWDASVFGTQPAARPSTAATAATTATTDTPVLLVYTSGTTGAPKGAVHTQGQLLANARIAAQVQGITPEDRVLTVLPLFHVGGLCIQTLPALYAGATVWLHERFDAQATLAAIASWRPTLTLLVPATLRALIEHPAWPNTDLGSLRAVWAGSSVIAPALIDAFHARGVPVCNVYGATETGPFSIALGAEHAASHAGSCGWPAPGVQARVLAATDGVGELLIRGPNVVRHYWPDRAATDAEGWFHSGDLARCEADGSWRIVGRAKDMIISGGENIYPAEIENLLAGHPQVADCAVIGQDDAQWGEVVVAVVVPRDAPDHAGLQSALQDLLQSRLARYKLPRRWVFLGELPRTALGKVRKDALKRQLAG